MGQIISFLCLSDVTPPDTKQCKLLFKTVCAVCAQAGSRKCEQHCQLGVRSEGDTDGNQVTSESIP